MAGIRIALSKGRIFEETRRCSSAPASRRRADPSARASSSSARAAPDVSLIVRATDTPTYVQHGGADLGIAGRDVLVEHGGEGLYQPVDLGIAPAA
jgi:ATP phosphoribosyltransferase